MTPLLIDTLDPHTTLEAHADGWTIRRADRGASLLLDEESIHKKASPLARMLLPYLSTLVAEERANQVNDNGREITLPVETVYWLLNSNLANAPETLADLNEQNDRPSGFAECLPPFAPVSLTLENNTYLSNPTLALSLYWRQGSKVVYPSRTGCVIQLGKKLYILDQAQYNIAEAVDRFNAYQTEFENTPDKVTDDTSPQLAKLAQVLGLCTDEVGLTDTLRDQRIVVPSCLKMDFETEVNGSLSVLPWTNLSQALGYPEASEEGEKASQSLWKQWVRQHDDAQPVYSHTLIPPTDQPNAPKRLRVVLNPELQKAVTHARRNLTGLTGDAKERVITRLSECFEEVCDPEVLETSLEQYGKRVIGLGPYVFHPVPALLSGHGSVLQGYQDDSSAAPSRRFVVQGIDGQGETQTIDLGNHHAMEKLQQTVTEALAQSLSTVQFPDQEGVLRTFPASSQFADQLGTILAKASQALPANSDTPPEKASGGGLFLEIIHHDNELIYKEKIGQGEKNYPLTLPHGLRKTLEGITEPFKLKPYQETGIQWLQTLFINKNPGVLLADDMGLGKTLQVLTFLAWIVESGWKETIKPGWNPEGLTGPAVFEHPILIVVPVTLLKNWEDEIKKYFKTNTFASVIIAHGKNLALLKGMGYSAQHKNNTDINYSALDKGRIQEHQVIITSYDTVKNYQRSFAQIPWSILVADEAQAIKNRCKTADALKAVACNSNFKIAMTGTPVENRLLELWNILDVVTPGELPGSAREFTKLYEQPDSDRDQLRERLGMKADQLAKKVVLGRTKEQYLSDILQPIKVEVHHYSIPAQDWDAQLRWVAEAKQQAKPAWQLTVIQKMARAFEHPSLLEQDWHTQPLDDLIKRWPKFQELYETLKAIQHKGEKVLIFTIRTDMQQLLRRFLIEKFRVNHIPLNSKVGTDGRYKIIETFTKTVGFDALILSPEVAGVGLNIVAANHVIHYGRWWNPALEDQATCRAYRLGQTRPVSVHYFVGQSPEPEKESFEQRLHFRLESKRKQRIDFLSPQGSIFNQDENLQNESENGIEDLLPQVDATVTNIPMTWETLNAESGHRFEAAIAYWMRKENPGQDVWLTPRSCDYGADVIVRNQNTQEVYLIQCTKRYDLEKLNQDFARALEYYPNHFSIPLKLIRYAAVLDSHPKKHLFSLNRQNTPWDFYDKINIITWLRKYPITINNLINEEHKRFSSLKELLLSI